MRYNKAKKGINLRSTNRINFLSSTNSSGVNSLAAADALSNPSSRFSKYAMSFFASILSNCMRSGGSEGTDEGRVILQRNAGYRKKRPMSHGEKAANSEMRGDDKRGTSAGLLSEGGENASPYRPTS